MCNLQRHSSAVVFFANLKQKQEPKPPRFVGFILIFEPMQVSYTVLTSTPHPPPSASNSVSAVLSLCFFSFLVTPAVSFQKKPISYSLLINPSSLFSIIAETGEISLTRPIDYESDQHRYLLLVRASEGLDSMSSAAEVCVCVCWKYKVIFLPSFSVAEWSSVPKDFWHYHVFSSRLAVCKEYYKQ